jgi:hypothetical protein
MNTSKSNFVETYVQCTFWLVCYKNEKAAAGSSSQELETAILKLRDTLRNLKKQVQFTRIFIN